MLLRSFAQLSISFPVSFPFARMVKSVNRYSKKILLGSRIAFEELETALRKIKLTLDNRPLTFTYEIGDEI